MIIKLKGATFSNNINGLLNSWPITFYGRTLVTGTFVSSVSKGETYTATFSVADQCTVDSVAITRGGTTMSGATISGNTITISVPTTTESGPISITFNGSKENGDDPVIPDTPYTFLSEREYPDTYVNINATSKAGDSLEMIAKFTYGRQTDPAGKKQILCGSNMGVLMMIHPETKVMNNNTSMGTYALTEGSEYYMKIKLVPSGSKSVMTSTIYNGTDTTLSTPLDTITRDITNTTQYPLYVGNSQITSAATLTATMNSGIKIKEFWVYKPSGTLIFNGVPAKRNSDNAYGLYDSVTQTFFAEEKIIIS